jgi:hypothetical protein
VTRSSATARRDQPPVPGTHGSQLGRPSGSS